VPRIGQLAIAVDACSYHNVTILRPRTHLMGPPSLHQNLGRSRAALASTVSASLGRRVAGSVAPSLGFEDSEVRTLPYSFRLMLSQNRLANIINAHERTFLEIWYER